MTRSNDATTTAIVKAAPEFSLPSCAIDEDDKLVERAAKQIREILARTVSQGLEDVGNYLLDAFYDGDVELYHSLKPTKHASLSMLERHCETLDLPVSRSFLSNAIGVAVMAKQLPRSSAFVKLPASHKQELLRVSSPEKADVLATRALDKKLSVQKLRELVRRDGGKSKDTPAKGRKRKATMLRVLSSCLRLLEDSDTHRLVFRTADFKELSADEVKQARALGQALRNRVADVLKGLDR